MSAGIHLLSCRSDCDRIRRKDSSLDKLIVTGLNIAAFVICLLQTQAQRQPFTVRDSIELTTFNEPSELERDAKPVFSPDGKHFLVVTTCGLIRLDRLKSVLWIYDTAAVRSFVTKQERQAQLKPRQIVSVIGVPLAFSLDAYDALISDVRWSADSRRVYFLSQSATGDQELYEVDARTTAARRLTPKGYDVQKFAVVDRTIAATVLRSLGKRDSSPLLSGQAINRNASAVTELPLVKILFPSGTDRWQDLRDIRVWTAKEGESGRFLGGANSHQIDTGVIDVLSLSPKSHSAVRLLPVESIPDSWTSYEPTPLLPAVRINPKKPDIVSPRNIMRLKSYVVLDLRSGKELFRINAPNARPLGLDIPDKAAWSADEYRLLLTNTFLPLEETSDQERARRHYPCVVADVELPSREVRCITFSHFGKPASQEPADTPSLRDVSFGADKDEVILQYRGSPSPLLERYRLHGDHWVLEEPVTSHGDTPPPPPSSNTAPSLSGLEVAVRQTLNSAPTLWATETSSRRTKQLWDPNPQLSRMKLGEASVYRWKGNDGVEWTGGLIKPLDYIPGKRYPLVIQTNGFSGSIFKEVTDGAFPTGMAARPLASVGIMVLQVPDNPGNVIATNAEAQRHVESFRSVIAQLTSEGLIDPKHVGIVGFSRTCWYVESALIKYPTLFAAATIVDGVDESYMQYLLFAQEAETWGEEFEKVNGAKPIGDGLKKWLAFSPGFHLDQVKTPLRIEAIGPRSVLLEWEIYSSLQQQGKPVDLIYIPGGQHILQKPLDRVASQQGNVDWFRFWLKGSDDHNPSTPVQYTQWEKLRALRDAESSQFSIKPGDEGRK
jgi:dipeptidyl aminopeptidase/acylaminoacyl peptidase